MSLIKKIFGDYSSREVKRVMPLQKQVLALDEEYQKLTDEELKAKTPEFKERLQNGETLDDILPEAFAACREAASRVLKMKHFQQGMTFIRIYFKDASLFKKLKIVIYHIILILGKSIQYLFSSKKERNFISMKNCFAKGIIYQCLRK